MMIVMLYIAEMEMLRLAASVKVKKTVRRPRGGKQKAQGQEEEIIDDYSRFHGT